MSRNDYYAILGISEAETLQGIHAAYRKLAKQCHPDRVGEQGTGKFQEIQEAYEVLSDPKRREPYDASLHRRRRPRIVTMEPLRASHYPSRVSRPEPLVRPSSVPEDLASTASRSIFCDDLGQDLDCGLFQRFHAMEKELELLILRYRKRR